MPYALSAAAAAPRARPESRHDAADTADFDAAMKGDFNAAIDKAVGAWKQSLSGNCRSCYPCCQPEGH